MMTIFHYLKKWASPVIVSQLTGQEYAPDEITSSEESMQFYDDLLIQ